MNETNVLHGPAPLLPIPNESVGILLHRYLVKFINQGDAFVDEITNQKLSFYDLVHASCRLAQCLSNCGVTSDKFLAISSENNIQFFVIVLACLYSGIPVVPLNPSYTESELDHALQLVEPDTIFCSQNCLPNFTKLKHVTKRLIVTNSTVELPGTISLQRFLHDNSDKNLDVCTFQPIDVDVKNHVAFIMFSSGTTGLPKGVMITHHNVNARLMMSFDHRIIPKQMSTISLGVLPFFHAYGLQVVLGNLINGRKTIVLERFDPVLYLRCIEKYRIPFLVAVPPLMQFFAKSELIDKYDLSCVEEIGCGAAPISEALEEAVKKRLNITKVSQAYGLTECTLGVTAIPTGCRRPGSVGQVNPGVSCIVRDPNTGQNLGPRQTGELCVKGDIVMKGYHKNVEATVETFTKDGWLRTGDMLYYDEDGYFYVVDRIKELIKYKGFQVAPAQLEAILLNNPDIKDAAVVGVPDDDAGELPLAFVVRQDGANLTEQDVQAYLAKFLSREKHLRGGVRFVESIPKNPSGKILRRELKKMLAANVKSKL